MARPDRLYPPTDQLDEVTREAGRPGQPSCDASAPEVAPV